MTSLDVRALEALGSVSMRLGSSGKRFRRDIQWHHEQDENFRLTARQARYLWLLIDMYRRQIPDVELRRLGASVKLTGELPDIYLDGDLAEPKDARDPIRVPPTFVRISKSRYEKELDRGGGRLAL